MKIEEQKYEDCDRCGERYMGENINAYLRTEALDGEIIRVCCPNGLKGEFLTTLVGSYKR
jgi:hypothetical protein